MERNSSIVNLGTILSLSFSFLLNSIKFYEEARKQVTINQFYARSITWYTILLIIGMLLLGIFVGLLISSRKQGPKKRR